MPEHDQPLSIPEPPEPDPNTAPNLHRAWERMFQAPRNEVAPQLPPLPLQLTLSPSVASAALSTRIETSQNWCGAEIIPNGGEEIVQIYGRWMVP